MKDTTLPTFKLQGGSYFRVKNRIKRHSISLFKTFNNIPDGRSKQGLRFPLPMLLFTAFCANLCGYTTCKDICLWAKAHKQLLQPYFHNSIQEYGIFNETTLSRAFALVKEADMVTCWSDAKKIVGIKEDEVFSIDGKVLCGIQEKGIDRHILSMIGHTTHKIYSQKTIPSKTNEIPCAQEMIKTSEFLRGKLILLDALHTQQNTAKVIREVGADYLFTIKGNQKGLQSSIAAQFTKEKTDIRSMKYIKDHCSYEMTGKGRYIQIEVDTIEDPLFNSIYSQEWRDIKTISRIHRVGIRNEKPFEETVYIISSRSLKAKSLAIHIRNHWCIENNLHWQKDNLFYEDHQTLRRGNAPRVMTFIRSMVLSIMAEFKCIREGVIRFQLDAGLLFRYLSTRNIV